MLDGVVDHWLLTTITDEPRGLSAAALQARLPPLRGVVLAQMIVGTEVDWQQERRALIDMVTHYLR